MAGQSKTQQALAFVADGLTITEAAAKAGIKQPTLSAALKRIRDQEAAGKERCPCCGQVVREGFSINKR